MPAVMVTRVHAAKVVLSKMPGVDQFAQIVGGQRVEDIFTHDTPRSMERSRKMGKLSS